MFCCFSHVNALGPLNSKTIKHPNKSCQENRTRHLHTRQSHPRQSDIMARFCTVPLSEGLRRPGWRQVLRAGRGDMGKRRGKENITMLVRNSAPDTTSRPEEQLQRHHHMTLKTPPTGAKFYCLLSNRFLQTENRFPSVKL